jgi:hypothetical protein
MAFFDFLFGSKEETQQPITTSSVTRSEIPEYIQRASQETLNEARRVISRPAPIYGGNRIAGFSPDTTAGLRFLRDNNPIGTQRMDEAYYAAQRGVDPITQEQIRENMNPFQQLVTEQNIRETQRQADIQANKIGAAAAQAGAFGGSRQGVIESNLNRDTQRQIGDIRQQGLASAYDRSVNFLENERARQLQGSNVLGSAAIGGQNVANQASTTLLGAGQLVEEKAQQGLDIAYGDFLREFNYPIEQLGFFSNIVAGQPYDRTSTTEQTTVNPNNPGSTGFFQTALGLGAAGAGIYRNIVGPWG